MKITIITSVFPPERGAAPSRLMTNARELKKRGVDVDIITALPNYPTGKIFKEYRGKLFVKEQINGIQCRRYWFYPSNSNNPYIRVFSMITQSFSIIFSIPHLIRRKPDIIIVQSPPLLSGFCGVYIGKIFGKKVIANISDIWPRTAIDLGVLKKGVICNFFNWIEKKMYRRADAFIGQSQEVLNYLNSFYPVKEKLLYRNLTKPSLNSVDSVRFEKNQLKIVYAGLLGLSQGVLDICRSIDFDQLGIKFDIYGHGVERSEIAAYISEKKFKNIRLLDTVPKNQVPAILCHYHATLVPLIRPIFGAFPSKIYMAVASRLPVFYSGGGSARNIVEQLNLGWTSDPGNYDQLHYNLERFKEISEKEYEEIRNSCTKANMNQFNYQLQQEKLYEFLSRMLVAPS